MKKSVCVLMACLMLLPLIAACNNSEHTEPISTVASDGDSTDSRKSTLKIIENGKSEFAIIANSSDALAKRFAAEVQEQISKTTGVVLPVRGPESKSKYDKFIVIGEEAGSELKDLAPENSYAVKVSDSALYLYADSTTGYIMLEKHFFEAILDSASYLLWEINVTDAYTGGNEENGATVTVSKDGSNAFHLIYKSGDEKSQQFANQMAKYLKFKTGVTVIPMSDNKQYKNEILLGDVNRTLAGTYGRYLVEEAQYVVGVTENGFVVSADDNLGMAGGVLTLISLFGANNGQTVVLEGPKIIEGTVDESRKDEQLLGVVEVYKEIYGTYGSWLEKKMTLSTSKEDIEDQALIEALIERMGSGVSMYIGSSSALYDGFIVKLDRNDYSKVTKLHDNDHILVSGDFMSEYLHNTALETDSDGYFDLTAYCANDSSFSLYYNESLKIAVFCPSDCVPYTDLQQKVNGYTNSEYLERMAEFFNNGILPEPSNNVEQTRVEIASSQFDSEYIYDYTQVYYDTYYSPGILITHDGNGDEVFYVVHEINTLADFKTKDTLTVLKKSTDQGKTWVEIGRFSPLQWASIFELNGNLYLIGYSRKTCCVAIVEFNVKSNTYRYKDLGLRVGGAAPGVVTIHKNRLFKPFGQAVISIDVDSDLFDPANWTLSNTPVEVLTQSIFEATTGIKVSSSSEYQLEEGTATVGPDGNVYVYYRIDAKPSYGRVALFRLSDDGKTLSIIQSCNSIVNMPTSESKFPIRYDYRTGLYITFTSLPTMGECLQRNVLVMAVSEDMYNWQVLDTILVERQMMNNTVSNYAHAYQYIEFDISRDNLYFVVREATGKTNTYHDGTFVTMYTIYNYVDFINSYLEIK